MEWGKQMIFNNEKYVLDCKRHRTDVYATNGSLKLDNELYGELVKCGDYAFKRWHPKVADSDASEYYSGYVRELDREFGLKIPANGSALNFEDKFDGKTIHSKPFRYRFNKARFQTAMFDILETKKAEELIKGSMGLWALIRNITRTQTGMTL